MPLVDKFFMKYRNLNLSLLHVGYRIACYSPKQVADFF